ncbi:cation transporter [Staphylococcus capitis]|uniref:cation transporter n=1 Tax=Staphylococcus capitis TaxID=29388 RepID=UPI00387DC87E
MISNSDMVLLDGLYSVISLVISSLSLFTSYMIKKPNRDSFPFGKYIFQPLTIVFNSSILLLCILSLISSTSAILNGGRIINANIGLGYGIFSFLGCGLIYLILFKNKNKSDFIYAEMLQWLLDTCVSFALIIGFVKIFVVKFTSFSWLIPYIDPGLVLIAGVVLIFMPIRLLFNNFKEIVSMSASDEIQYNLHEIIKEMNAKYYIKEEDLRITKIGQMIYIDLQNIVDNTSKIQTIKQAYKYRNEVIEIINKDLNNFDKWLNISFTKQFYSKQIN